MRSTELGWRPFRSLFPESTTMNLSGFFRLPGRMKMVLHDEIGTFGTFNAKPSGKK